jgi:hypothetical protein
VLREGLRRSRLSFPLLRRRPERRTAAH